MESSNIYTLNRAVSVATAITVLQLQAAAAKPIRIVRAWATQNSSTTSTQVGIELIRKTAGATVTAAVAADIKKANPSASASSVQLGTANTGYFATGEGTDGDALVIDGFNVLNGWNYIPVPEERPIVAGGGIIAIKFTTTQATATYACGIVWEEYG